MGGSFTGKDQDSTAGIYALAGMYGIVCYVIFYVMINRCMWLVVHSDKHMRHV